MQERSGTIARLAAFVAAVPINHQGLTMMTKLHTLFTLALLAAASFTVAACNTVEGAGQDVENAGEAVQDAAR